MSWEQNILYTYEKTFFKMGIRNYRIAELQLIHVNPR